PETVDEAKAAESMQFLAGFINLLTRQPSLVRMDNDIKGGPVEVSGRVVEFDVLAGVFPNQPVAGSLVLFPQNFLNLGSRETVSTNAGVRRMALTTVDTNGRYRIRGIPDRRAITTKQDVEIFAFHFGVDGKIDYTVDRSPQGTDMLSNRLTRRFVREDVSIVIAPMRGLAIFDLLDPRVLTPLLEIKLLNAASLSRPDHSALFLPNSLIPGDNGPYTENCGVIYGPVEANMVALVNQGLSGTRASLINTAAGSSEKHIGFSTNTPGGRINATALRIAADLVAVNHDRLAKLSKYGIQNTLLNDLDKQAQASLDEAQKALTNREYSRAYRAGTHAWGVALRAYPDVRSLGKDAVIASVFFLALVLPFAFFIERLTIRAKNPNLRVIWTLVIFLALFGLMWCIHPAFAIALSPMIVLLAFVMIILMLVVTSIVYRKFVNLIKEYRSQLEGVHGADLKRFSASGVALNLSLSTMARRKARTLLTGATLTMLAFAIVTFSSINSSISFRQTLIAKVTPTYNGLLFHTPQWTDIPVSVIDGFVNEFGLDHTVLTRVWKLKTQDAWRLGNPANTRISIRQVDPMGRAIGKQTGYVRGLIGVVPEEAKVFPPEKMLTAGHWLREGYPDDAVIAPSVAASLGITAADLDTPKARVGMFDQTFMVVGILNVAGANAWRDLDGSTTAPLDFAAAGGDGAQSRDIANLGTFDPNNRLPQLPMDEMIFVPAARALRMEGTVKSVAVRFADQANAAELMNRLMTRLKVPVFAGVDGKAVLYESVDTSSVEGIGRLVVPILLAIFMIVNTLLGTVEERKDEIAMLNSVGLAPAHVGMLFLVEAVVYGVLGLVIGYLIGLGLAYVLLGNQGLREAVGAANMSLNYSSGSTVLSCVLVLVIVVLSALYPASQARKLATPGNMASWSLPPSEDGTLAVEVPFTLTGGNALGMLGFLDEYLASHHESTSPDFRVMWRKFMEVTGPSGRELRLEGEAYLAPYDLGVAEKFGVAIWQTKEATIFRVRFDIARTAGEMSSFRRATQIFLDHLRQQFLIWRTLSTEDKQKYVQRTIQGYKTGTASVA
ncbi:MAG: FtsX-like permease family protein, partial [Phycisphaerae bacterium]